MYTEDEDLGKSSMTGAAYGLSLVLNIEQDSYLRGGPISMVRTKHAIHYTNITLTLITRLLGPGYLSRTGRVCL